MIKASAFFLISLFAFAVFAQETIPPKSPLSAYIIKSTVGTTTGSTLVFTDSDWERRTPGVSVPDSFQVNPNGVDQFNPEINKVYVMHTLAFIHNKEKQAGKNYRFTTALHVGIGAPVVANNYWFHENREVLDTLISLQTGNSYEITGSRRTDIQKAYWSKSAVLGIGEHFATNPEKQFQFETGVDVLVLYNSSETKSYVRESYRVDGVAGGNSLYPQPVLSEPQSVTHTGKNLFGLIFRVPLEVSVPLSHTNPVLKRMRIGVEMNLGFAVYFTAGKTNYGNGMNASGGFNFRYEFEKFRSPFRPKSQTPVSN